ncbi:MAG: phosphotransferase [Candidatus Poribacteria bacterium]|nr:MAG: phosphotransferase [Candidatus Poribacteria bacterium]
MSMLSSDRNAGIAYDYAGAIHIHSTLSDGSGTVPQIVEHAQEAGLDFLILTDHEHLQARELGFEGWHDELLLLVGEEVTPRFHNHYLAFDIERPVRGRGNWNRPQQLIDAVAEQGGLGFIAHPIGEGYPTRAMACPWLDWTVSGFTGIEIWSYMHDWARNLRWSNVAAALARPDSIVRGPHREALRRWDAIGKCRRVVGLGTLDIHAKRIPGLVYPTVLPYRFAFGTVRTHILLESPLSRSDWQRAARQVYDALRNGRCFFAHDGFGDSTGFHFVAQRQNAVVGWMGEELPFSPDLTLIASAPESAHLCLLRDGVVVAEGDGKRLRFRVDRPGVYRVEVRKKFRPWIFSNPIYIRDGEAEALSA